jgi:hypothetical protein
LSLLGLLALCAPGVTYADSITEGKLKGLATALTEKPALVEVGVGFLGGKIAGGLVKSFTKFAIIVGAGVFVAAHGIVKVALPKVVEGQDAIIKGAEKILEDANEQATNFLDFDNDGKVTGKDLAGFSEKKMVPFIKKHVPLSGGFLAGFLSSL